MKYLQKAIVLISLAFMFFLLQNQWNEIQDIKVEIRPFYLIISSLLLILIFFLDALGWHLILNAMGHHPSPVRSMYVWMISSITRYLPGGIWAYTSRAVMAKELGISLKSSIVSMYIETILLVSSALIVGLPALLYITDISTNPLVILLVVPILGLFLHPKVFRIFRFLPGEICQKISSLDLLPAKVTFALYVYYIVFWLLFGAVFVCFSQAIYPTGIENWIVIASSMAIGFSIGFIVIIFPGGIGIRESTIYFMLLPIFPPTACLIVSIGSRIWIIIAEILSTLTVILINQRKQKKTNQC